MNKKGNAPLIAGIVVVLLFVGVVLAGRGIIPDPTGGILDELIPDAHPEVESTTQGYERSVSLFGKYHEVNDDFCESVLYFSTKTVKDAQTAGIDTGADFDMFTGECLSWDGKYTLSSSQKKRYDNPDQGAGDYCRASALEACGSGAGVPTQRVCTDKVKAELEGSVTVGNHKTSFLGSYKLVLAGLSVNPIKAVPSCIFCKSGKVKMNLYNDKGDTVTDEVTIDFNEEIGNAITNGQATSFPFRFTYRVTDKDCDERLDDHVLKMQVDLYDAAGALVETSSTSVGLSKGAPIPAGWTYEKA